MAYVDALGPMSANVPIDQTTLTGGGMGRWKKLGDDELAIVRQGILDRTSTAALAQKLGRNINTVYSAIKKIKAEIEERKVVDPADAAETQRRLPFDGEPVPQPPPTPLDQVFAKQPLLYSKLKKMAELQFRSAEAQVLHTIARSVRSFERDRGVAIERMELLGIAPSEDNAQHP